MAIQPVLIVSTMIGLQGRRIRDYRLPVRGIRVRSPTIGQAMLGGLEYGTAVVPE